MLHWVRVLYLGIDTRHSDNNYILILVRCSTGTQSQHRYSPLRYRYSMQNFTNQRAPIQKIHWGIGTPLRYRYSTLKTYNLYISVTVLQCHAAPSPFSRPFRAKTTQLIPILYRCVDKPLLLQPFR